MFSGSYINGDHWNNKLTFNFSFPDFVQARRQGHWDRRQVHLRLHAQRHRQASDQRLRTRRRRHLRVLRKERLRGDEPAHHCHHGTISRLVYFLIVNIIECFFEYELLRFRFSIRLLKSGYLNSSFVKRLTVENQLGDDSTNLAKPNYFWNSLVS